MSTLQYIPYVVPQPLWYLIVEDVPIHEQEEMKRMLGESLVEQSLDLNNEVFYIVFYT